jgi:hypothetical protein
MDRTKLPQALDEAERHIAAAAEYIRTQQQIIRKLESTRRGHSPAAKTARKVLAGMERAQEGYIAQCEQIRRWLAH